MGHKTDGQCELCIGTHRCASMVTLQVDPGGRPDQGRDGSTTSQSLRRRHSTSASNGTTSRQTLGSGPIMRMNSPRITSSERDPVLLWIADLIETAHRTSLVTLFLVLLRKCDLECVHTLKRVAPRLYLLIIWHC